MHLVNPASWLLLVGLASASSKQFTQIHLAFGHSVDEMSVAWASQQYFDNATVRYGLSGGDLADSAAANVTQYTRGDYTSPFIYNALLTGLAPNTKYFYQVGDTETDLWSATAYFYSNVETSYPVTFASFGDIGQTSYSANTVKMMARDESLRFVLTCGDMAYADCGEDRWDSWFDMVEPASKRLPWMVAIGNHEIEGDPQGHTFFNAYAKRFFMPQFAPPNDTTPRDMYHHCIPSDFSTNYNYGNAYYSFEYGPIFFLTLSTYTDTSVGSPQYKYLELTLKNINRTRTPWVIAQWHSPFYNTNYKHRNEKNAVVMKAAMEDLLHEYRVDIAFTGHVHSYERTHRVFQEQRDPTGTTYLNVGAGGNHEGLNQDWATPLAWSASHNSDTYGYGILKVLNDTHAKWTWYSNMDLGSVVDTAFIHHTRA